MPQSFITSAVHNAARGLPGYPGLSALDLGCGSGEILALLAEDGCRVRGTRFRDDDYIMEGDESRVDDAIVDRGVDLRRPLPYRDASFDLVLLTEVVEHLGDYTPVVRESGRLLRPGGHLLLTSPNLQRLHSRAHYFWTGTHKLVRRRVGWDVPADELYAYHVSPVDFPLLHTLLHRSGLQTVALGYTRVKGRHAWWMLFYPLYALMTRLEMRRAGNTERRAGERDLYRWMVHPAMLLSEQLLLTARREKG
jgi:SAM-dependent methyltransferase